MVANDASAGRRKATISSRSRSSVLAVLDQLLSSGTNFLTVYLGSRALSVSDFGAFVVGLSTATLICSLQRGLVAEPLLVQHSYRDTGRRQLFSDAVIAAAIIGLLAGLVASVLLLLRQPLFSGLLWFLPWVPVYLIQDVSRYVCFQDGRLGEALIIDAIWAASYIVGIPLLLASGEIHNPTWIASLWGMGAASGGVYFILKSRKLITKPSARRWLRGTRKLSGWFSASSFMSQAQDQLLLVLVGFLVSPAATAGFRSLQLLLMQPVQTCLVGLNSVIVPRIARKSSAGGRDIGKELNRLVLIFGLAGSSSLVIAAFASPALDLLFPEYLSFADLAYPVALLAVLWCAAMPATFVLKATSRGDVLFSVISTRAVVLVAFGTAGAAIAGLSGFLWGMVLSSSLHLLATLVILRRVLGTTRRQHGLTVNEER